MKILVTGATGLLGSEIVGEGLARGWTVVAPPRNELDVTHEARCRNRILAEAPDWVVHCAAYTGVDQAEAETEVAMRVNAEGTEIVARAAADAGAGLVFISTDYVFPGTGERPWAPNDPVAPQGVYARSKRAGEVAVQSVASEAPSTGAAGLPGHLIVRTSWLYGDGGSNFVDAMLARGRAGEKLRVVNDQTGRPTWTRNAARAVLDLAAEGAVGVWHVADGGEATWFELAQEALRLAGVKVEVEGVSTAAWGAAAPRPLYSVLDTSATETRLDRTTQPWPDALRAYLNERHPRDGEMT